MGKSIKLKNSKLKLKNSKYNKDVNLYSFDSEFIRFIGFDPFLKYSINTIIEHILTLVVCEKKCMVSIGKNHIKKVCYQFNDILHYYFNTIIIKNKFCTKFKDFFTLEVIVGIVNAMVEFDNYSTFICAYKTILSAVTEIDVVF